MLNANYLNIKVPLQAVGWKTKLILDLEGLVCQTNFLTEHTYQLTAWIIAGELKLRPEFDPGIELFGTSSFFYHVFMRLVRISAEDIDKAKEQFIGLDPPGPKAKGFHPIRDLIKHHFHGYLVLTSMEPVNYKAMSYIATDVGVQVKTAYLNNIKTHFGKILKNTIRHLL
ncbi:hypothetical protein H4R26_001608 [Coemansia thaxteri]|uniref:Uncharacterized protein n=1 Tax=Coemansia thaxteri TaxID=2663907 RepID=A0A9W8BKE8_9FUNG|nr:hypothetical protein H4R26_001608 [Coemansia thaxteri]